MSAELAQSRCQKSTMSFKVSKEVAPVVAAAEGETKWQGRKGRIKSQQSTFYVGKGAGRGDNISERQQTTDKG